MSDEKTPELIRPETVRSIVRKFSEALQAKDTSMLQPSVAPQFSVATATWPASKLYLQQLFAITPPIDSIVPAPETIAAMRGGEKQKVEATVFTGGAAEKTTIVFDAASQKIVYVDYLDNFYGLFHNRPSRLVATLPIESDSASIIVHIKLNKYEKALRFLFDSGADGMAVSKDLAAKAGLKITRTQGTSVVGGHMQVQISGDNTVCLDTLVITGQNIAVFSEIKEGVDGIIGLNLAKKFIVKVDFDAQKMHLYSMGNYTYESEGETIPVAVPAGVMVIPGELNLTGKDTVRGNFVFDTGANYYFMGYSPFVRTNRLLLSGFKPESQSATMSMGHVTPVFEGHAKEFGFGHTIRLANMPVSLQASTGADNWDPGADASIGFGLIRNYNFTINLLEKEIHLAAR